MVAILAPKALATELELEPYRWLKAVSQKWRHNNNHFEKRLINDGKFSNQILKMSSKGVNGPVKFCRKQIIESAKICEIETSFIIPKSKCSYPFP